MKEINPDHLIKRGSISKEEFALNKLNILANELKKLGLTPCDRFFNLETLKDPSAIAGFPLVEDGSNGIRMSYEDGKMTLWFTNSFSDPNNEIRKKVEEIWNNLNN